MSLYQRNLKKIGIYMVVLSILNLVYELVVRKVLTDMGSVYVSHIPLPWGIWTKNLIGVAAGCVSLLFYRKQKHYRTGTVILVLMCLAEAAVIIMSMTGKIGKRTNGLIDLTMLMMVLLAYTFSQADRDTKQWLRIRAREEVSLDLKLKDRMAFFDPVQIGPNMAINQEYAGVINRYLISQREPAPLKINMICADPVSEPVQDMMQEVLSMHYEAEESRISKELERKYRRIMLLITVSVFAIGIIRQIALLDEDQIVWDIIGNFAAFGLWQIGYTHYERNEGYEELLLVHIAKYAKLHFISK